MARTALTQRVLDLRLWGDRPFFLLDVGCSGGLDGVWQIFDGRLRAVGFDPLVAEIERLRSANTDPGITYEAAFVVCRDYDALFPPAVRNDRAQSKNNDPFPRVSASAPQCRAVSYVQEVYNAGAPVVLAERTVSLDEYVPPDERSSVDFIKVDTDGHDIEVLLGARQILSAGGAIGMRVEAQLHGSTHGLANTFANIDPLLRRAGFTLFDLEVYRYSRAALPSPFVLDLPAQTESGQVLWGETLYLRDLADPDYGRMWPDYAITPERIMKLACLFELHRLPDCAAELLLNRGGFLADETRTALLDQLVTKKPGSYAEHMQRWQADFTAFYSSRWWQEAAAASQLVDFGGPGADASKGEETTGSDEAHELQRLRARVSVLKHQNAKLSEKLLRRNRRLRRLTEQLEESKSKPT